MLLCPSNSFSPRYEESRGQRVVYPQWLLSWELFKAGSRPQLYAATCIAHCVHSKARCGVQPVGKAGQHGFTPCNFSSSEINHPFIHKLCIFVHNMQSHIEVCVSFLTFNLSKCLCTHKHKHPTSFHHSWELWEESGEPCSDWGGGGGVTNHYFTFSLFPAQAVYSVTTYTVFFI